MDDREKLVDYRSLDGEHIVITTGWATRTGTLDGTRGKRFTRYSTEVYVNGVLLKRYEGELSEKIRDREERVCNAEGWSYREEGDLFEEQIPYMLPILEEAKRERIDSEELISALDAKIAELAEMEDAVRDDPDRFKEFS